MCETIQTACNSNEFPENRRKCIQCNNKVDGDCPHQSNTGTIEKYSKYCKKPTDECISIRYEDSNDFMEACASYISGNDENYCKKNSERCLSCSSSNNCNLILIPDLPTSTTPQPTTTTQPTAATQEPTTTAEPTATTQEPKPGYTRIIIVVSLTVIAFVALVYFLRKKK